MRKWYAMRADAGARSAEITLYGDIGPSFWGEETVDAKSFLADLKALGEVEEIVLRVNSPGGDVFDGLAIHNQIAAHPARVVAHIDGLAASAASLVIMAADEIVAPENAFLLIHEPRGMAFGTSDAMIATAADLERMTETFAATYAKRSGQTVDDVKSLMKEDRLMDAGEAKALGYVDRLAEPVKMAASYPITRLPDAARAKLAAVMHVDSDPPADKKEPAAAAPDDSASGDNVIDLDAVRAEARKGGEGAAYAAAAEIARLCKVAGEHDLSAELIAKRMSVEDAGKAIIAARAKRDEAAAISNMRRFADDKPAGGAKASLDAAVSRFNSQVR